MAIQPWGIRNLTDFPRYPYAQDVVTLNSGTITTNQDACIDLIVTTEVSGNSDIQFEAGNKIYFGPGFQVASDSETFTATVNPLKSLRH